MAWLPKSGIAFKLGSGTGYQSPTFGFQPFSQPSSTPTASAATVPAATPAAASPTSYAGNVSYQNSDYNNTENLIGTNLANLEANLIGKGNALGLNYGVGFKGDPVHGASGFNIAPDVDVTNPFSKAALLKRSYQQATTGNTNSYAAAGQLYSGAEQNAQNETGWRYQQGNDALLKDFAGQFSGLSDTYQAGQAAAEQQRLDNMSNAIAAAGAAQAAAQGGTPAVYQTPSDFQLPTTPNGAPGPAITDVVTGQVYQPAQGVAVAPGWIIANGQLVKVG